MINVGTCKETFNAPIGEVWAVIAAIGAEKSWIEGVLKVSLEGAGLGALRTLTFKDYIAVERIEECDAVKHRVVYRLLDPAAIAVNGAYGVMELSSSDPSTTRIDWNSYAESITGDVVAIQLQVSQLYHQCCLNIKRYIGCS